MTEKEITKAGIYTIGIFLLAFALLLCIPMASAVNVGFYNGNPKVVIGMDECTCYQNNTYNITNYLTNTSYYLAINPFGFYNETDFNISDYFTSIETTSYIDANITTANTSMKDWVDAQSFLTSETTWLGNYSDYVTIRTYATNDTDYNSSGLIIDWNSSGLIKDWIETLWNGNYSTFLTHITWANAINGTLTKQADFDSNYSANDANYRSFSGNYSTFLTHITWANAVNGTLMEQSDFDNNYSANDAAYRNTTNTSYLTEESKWNGNYSNFSFVYSYAVNDTDYNSTGLIKNWWADIMNYTMATWAQVMNGTVISGLIDWSKAANGTLMEQSDFDSNYSANDVAYRNTTNTSYILWSNAINGTLASAGSAKCTAGQYVTNVTTNGGVSLVCSAPTSSGTNVTICTSTGACTWNKPTSGSMVRVQMWAGGGSGGCGGTADAGGGGGGGGYLEFTRRIADFAAAETCTVGAGGGTRTGDQTGIAGGSTTMTVNGVTYTVYGGGGGYGATTADGGGGGGGGTWGAGLVGTATAGGLGGIGCTGASLGTPVNSYGFECGGGGGTLAGGYGSWGGGGGGFGNDNGVSNSGGNSIWGGGGGAGGDGAGAPEGVGGISMYGGNGGTGATAGGTAVNGTQPSGGGGGAECDATGTSGAGGDGMCIITVI